jgi:copper transport protein
VIRRAAVLALALAAGEAFAHAGLSAAEPADGAVLERAPAAVVLRFSEPVTPIVVRLFDRAGTRVELQPQAEGETVRAELPALPAGPYLVSFRVTSLDSHPVGGTIAFSIGSPERLAASAAPDEAASAAALRALVRAVHDLALALAAGGALFALLVAPFPGQRRVLRGAAAVACVAAIASVGLHGAAFLDSTLFDAAAWRVGFATSRGTAAIVACAGAVAIALGRPWLLGAGALLAIASFALTGHAAAAEPRAVAAALIVLHVAAAAFWAGSLVALAAILRRSTEAAAASALRRFSAFGVIAVPALMAAGVGFAVMQLGSFGELVSSGYGRWITAKSALLAALLALAAWNRLRLLPALERGTPDAVRRFRRTVGTEVVVIGAVIVAAAMLAQTPPPRAVSTETVVVLEDSGYTMRLAVRPARAGVNAFAVTFAKDGAPFDPPEVSLEIGSIAGGVEPIVRDAVRVAPGDYRTESAPLMFPGEWAIVIRARVSDFDQVAVRARVAIR